MKHVIGPVVLSLVAFCATVDTQAATWERRIESQVGFEPTGGSIASGGAFWIGAYTRDGDTAIVRIDATSGATVVLPVRGDFVVFARAPDGGVYAAVGGELLRAAPDGAVGWRSSIGSSFVEFPRLSALAGGDLLFAARDFSAASAGTLRLARLRGSDGSVVWARSIAVATNECASAEPVPLGGNRIQVSCGRDPAESQAVRVFDAANGSSLPEIRPTIDGRAVTVLGSASTATSDLFVLVRDEGITRAMRIDAAGATRWSVETSGSNLQMLGETLVYSLSSADSTVLRATDGTVAWRPGADGLVYDGGGATYRVERIDAGSSFRVSRVNPGSGAVLWTDPVPVQFASGSPFTSADATGLVAAEQGGAREMLTAYSWTAAGTRRAPVVPVVPSTSYAFVDQRGDSVVFTRNTASGAASRTHVGSVDIASGAVRWESTLQEREDEDIAARGACIASDGTVVAVSASVFADPYRPIGPSRIAGFAPATGAEIWRADVGSFFEPVTLTQAICDDVGNVYTLVSRNLDLGEVQLALRAYDAATGEVRWDRDLADQETAAEFQPNYPFRRGPLLQRNVAPREILQLDPATGATSWTQILPDVSRFARALWLSNGDPVLLSIAGSGREEDLLVQRIDRTTGALRWARRLDGPYGGLQSANVLSLGPNDEIFVAGRNSEGPAWGRGSLALLDPANGAARWNVELPRRPLTYASPSNVRVLPDGATLQLLHSTSPVFDVETPGRYELVTLDAATGAFRFARLLGPGASPLGGTDPYADSPAQMAIFAGGDVLTRRLEGGSGVRAATVLKREPAAPQATGDAAVNLRLAAVTGTDVRRAAFRIEGSYSGSAAVSGAQLRALLPPGVVLASWTCRVEGGGACGAVARERHVRQQVDLAPGARVVVDASIDLPFALVLRDFHAWLDLPFAVGDTEPRNNVAIVQPGPGNEIDLVADQRFSGSWFDPTRSGEGWILEILPDDTALLFWFTYPPAGAAGDQQWLIAQNGEVRGSQIVFDEIYSTSGTRFGAAFDAGDVRLTRWGEIRITFSDCDSGTIRYIGRPPFGNIDVPRPITRLTSLAGVGCGGPSAPPTAIRSGAWYDPQRAGEGWIVEALPDGRATVYWFTYSPDGNQAWTFGTGTLAGDRLRIDDMRRPRGTRFGTGFDATDVNVAPWGTLQIDFSGCNGGTLSYTSSEAGYDSASRSIARLTRIAGTSCP